MTATAVMVFGYSPWVVGVLAWPRQATPIIRLVVEQPWLKTLLLDDSEVGFSI